MKLLHYVREQFYKRLKEEYPNIGEEILDLLVDEQVHDLIELNNLIVPDYIKSQEAKKIEYFRDVHEIGSNPYFDWEGFLYHGLQWHYSVFEGLEKLRSIFESGKILCGNRIPDYICYKFNCNEGEYVSLAEYKTDEKTCFDYFVENNVTLIINGNIDAEKAHYISNYEWGELKDSGYTPKHRYSYVLGEYHVKGEIPLEKVVGIAIPFFKLKINGKREQAEDLLLQVYTLMQQYNIDLPIYDISSYNEILSNGSGDNSFSLRFRNKTML